MTYRYSPFYPYNNYSNYNYLNYYNQFYYPKTHKKYNNNLIHEKKEINIEKKTQINEKIKEEPESREFFEVFGIQLYFDDMLLICLIFFLYNEGVKDQYLFISLILLLLS